MKLSFSLNSSKKPRGSVPAPAPPISKASAFASLEDDSADPLDLNRHPAGGKPPVSTPAESLSRAQKQKLEKEKEVDPTVFEYDEVYDQMKEAQMRVKQAKEDDPEAKKPKYISGLLTSAATRKLDYIRAEEKLIQRERKVEGDEFADKEKFVTQAYKDQMAEVRRAEEEEKEREAAERAKRGTTGMSHFYRELLQQSEKEHQATVAATSVTKGPTLPDAKPVNLRIQRPLKPAVMSDAMLAAMAKEEGKDVELNDDNQIVDRRELLSGGLNLAGVNTRRLGGLLSSRSKPTSNPDKPVETHRASGAAASKAEIRARQTALLQQQLKEEEERIRQEKEQREDEERERNVKRKNNEDDIKSARERYLERKKRRMEQPDANEDTLMLY